MKIKTAIQSFLRKIGKYITMPFRAYAKLWKSIRWLFILITIAIFVGIYFLYAWRQQMSKKDNLDDLPIPQVEDVVLSTGQITSSVKLSGTSKLENEQTLKFTKSGKIVSVVAKAGQKVKLGQILASVDQSEIVSRIQKARTVYEKAKRTMDDLLNGKDKTKVLSAEYDYQEQEINVEKTKDQLSYALSTKETKLSDAKANLEAQERLYTLEKEKYDLELKTFEEEHIKKDKLALDHVNRDYVTMFEQRTRTIKNLLSSLDSTFDAMDKYLGVKEKISHELSKGAMMYFGAKNTSYRNNAKQSLGEVYSSWSKINEYITDFEKKSQSEYDMHLFLPAYEELKKLYISMYDLGENFALAAKNSVDSVDFPLSDISSLESIGNSAKDSASSALSDIDKNIDEIKLIPSLDKQDAQKKIAYLEQLKKYEEKKSKVFESKLNYQEAMHKYDQLQKDIKREIAEKQLAVKMAENTLKDKKDKLKDIKKGYTEDELQNAKDAIADAKVNLEAVEKERENYYLKATFDGTVRKVDMQIGDNLTEDNDKSIVLENRDMIKIEMKASQSDILKLKVGQEVSITFDAFPDSQFKGSIIEIDETPQKTDGIVKYKVVASVLNTEKTKIFSDMSALVDVYVSKKTETKIVPVNAVAYGDEGAYVVASKDGRHIPVTVGESDGMNIEVLSGLDMSTKIKSSAFNVDAIEGMGINQGGNDEMGGQMGGEMDY